MKKEHIQKIEQLKKQAKERKLLEKVITISYSNYPIDSESIEIQNEFLDDHWDDFADFNDPLIVYTVKAMGVIKNVLKKHKVFQTKGDEIVGYIPGPWEEEIERMYKKALYLKTKKGKLEIEEIKELENWGLA